MTFAMPKKLQPLNEGEDSVDGRESGRPADSHELVAALARAVDDKCARQDSNLRPPAPEAGALSS